MGEPEIRYEDPHARGQMLERGIREEHVRCVLENGEFVRLNRTRTAELRTPKIVDSWVVVVVELGGPPYRVRTAYKRKSRP